MKREPERTILTLIRPRSISCSTAFTLQLRTATNSTSSNPVYTLWGGPLPTTGSDRGWGPHMMNTPPPRSRFNGQNGDIIRRWVFYCHRRNSWSASRRVWRVGTQSSNKGVLRPSISRTYLWSFGSVQVSREVVRTPGETPEKLLFPSLRPQDQGRSRPLQLRSPRTVRSDRICVGIGRSNAPRV